MFEFLRRALTHLLIPAVVGGLWAYAHLRSTASGKLTASWREGPAGIIRTGDPYAAPVREFFVPDPEPAPTTAVADTSAPDDTRP